MRTKNKLTSELEEKIAILIKDGINMATIGHDLDVSSGIIKKVMQKRNISTVLPKELLGLRFGMLTVTSATTKTNKHKSRLWECKCTCGNVKLISRNNLEMGTRSCGCLNDRLYGELPATYYALLKRDAARRSLSFLVSPKFIWDLFISQNRKCLLTNRELKFAAAGEISSAKTASLDRIDSSKGYIEGNVRWVHKQVNLCKWAMSDSEFIGWCQKIADNNP